MSDSSPRFLIGAFAASFALALILYAVSFVGSAWRFAQAEPQYDAVARGKLGTVIELDALTRALRVSPMRADLNRAGFVQVVTAQREGLKSARAATRMFSARRDLRAGLGIAPSDSLAWTRLAVAEHTLGNRERAAAALSVALQVAPAERKAIALQLDLALLLWPELDRAGKVSIERRLGDAEKSPHLAPVLAGNSAQALRRKLEEEKREP